MARVPTKVCRTCQTEYPATLEHFYRNRGAKDGLGRKCKDCAKAYSRQYAREHAQERQEYQKRYREAHQEERAAYAAVYNEQRKRTPKESRVTRMCRKCGRELPATQEFFGPSQLSPDGLRSQCRQCNAEASRAYRQSHPGAHLVTVRKWKERNREHVAAYTSRYNASPLVRARTNAWAKAKYTTSTVFRLRATVSSCINQSLRGNRNGAHWEILVGYTVTELRDHLESMFAPGMTWDNYGRGGWEIDHVRPVSSFTFTSANEPEFGECWSLSNLQPMWWWENRSKSDRYPGKGGEAIASA